MFDLVIRDAELLDGLGSPPSRGALAVKDGRIVAVGEVSGAARRETVNADGLALMPGIIDNHTLRRAARGIRGLLLRRRSASRPRSSATAASPSRRAARATVSW